MGDIPEIALSCWQAVFVEIVEGAAFSQLEVGGALRFRLEAKLGWNGGIVE